MPIFEFLGSYKSWNAKTMKKHLFLLSLLSAALLLPYQLQGAEEKLVGNAQNGKVKTQTCIVCHGSDGNGVAANFPKIAGQYENYLVKQLKDFKMGQKGPRYDPVMYPMVTDLSDQDIADLAAFYAEQKQTLGKTKEEYLALGEKIYRGGSQASGVTACIACHGPEGMGNEAANFPRISGQYAQYIETTLLAFRDGKRTNSPYGMMGTISHHMKDDEIKAVSSYIEGLR